MHSFFGIPESARDNIFLRYVWWPRYVADIFARLRIATRQVNQTTQQSAKGGVSSWQNASQPSPGQVVGDLVPMVLALSNEKTWCPWFWQ